MKTAPSGRETAFEDGALVPTTPFPFPDDEPGLADEPERDAARTMIELVLEGRTAGSVRLRAEVLRHIAEGQHPVESIGAMARRLGVSRRTLERTRAALMRTVAGKRV